MFRIPGFTLAQNCPRTTVPKSGVIISRHSLSSVSQLLSPATLSIQSAAHPPSASQSTLSLPVLLSNPALRKETATEPFTLK